MLRVGIAGIGFMGWIHWLAYQRVKDCRVVAICTRDPRKRSGDWTGIRGNFGPPGEKVDLSGVRAYAELSELLADQEVDLVDICLPPYLHEAAAVESVRSGKHVFVEKPLGLNADQCRRIVQAAEASQRLVLVGHVLPFFPEYAYARQAIQQGTYGKLLGGNFKRIISEPEWLPDFFDPNRIGGPLIDLHVHDAHWIRFLFGMPQAVASQGRCRGEVVEYCTSLFYYHEGNYAVSSVCGVIRQQGRPFTHGFEIHCERATLQYEFAVIDGKPRMLIPLTVYHADGRTEEPALGSGDPVDAFVAEVTEVRDAVASGQPSQLLGGDLARDAIILCQCQSDSVRQQKIVTVPAG
ncbi:MAG: oxidoreductase [Pirellulaceae bacterium]|nr:MAG: oxidoreductase [Pirellulaceae bacterium]